MTSGSVDVRHELAEQGRRIIVDEVKGNRKGKGKATI